MTYIIKLYIYTYIYGLTIYKLCVNILTSHTLFTLYNTLINETYSHTSINMVTVECYYIRIPVNSDHL